jgi:hypothetical protein
MHHMIRGKYAPQWWLGQLLLVVVPIVALMTGVEALGGASAMAGVFLADDAFVKAGQSVPLS